MIERLDIAAVLDKVAAICGFPIVQNCNGMNSRDVGRDVATRVAGQKNILRSNRLGACPSITRHRVSSTVVPLALLAGSDARCRAAGDVSGRRCAPASTSSSWAQPSRACQISCCFHEYRISRGNWSAPPYSDEGCSNGLCLGAALSVAETLFPSQAKNQGALNPVENINYTLADSVAASKFLSTWWRIPY
jgi:hypothetical protein